MGFIVWVIFTFLVSRYGASRRLGSGWAFVLSLIFSPVIGFIIAVLSGRRY
jgi:hypothetical protein